MSNLEDKLNRLLDDKFDTFEVLSECRKLKVNVDFPVDYTCQKHLLQRSLLIEILKNDLEKHKKNSYEKLLESTQNFLKWKQEKLKGIPCSFAGCLFRGKRHRDYVKHLKAVHPNQTTFRCKHRLLCKRNFFSVEELEKHIQNDHVAVREECETEEVLLASSSENCKCVMISCGQKRFKSVRELTSHLNTVHVTQPRACVFDDCVTLFEAGKASRHHFNSKHFQVNKLALKSENRIESVIAIIDVETQSPIDAYEPPFGLDETLDDFNEEASDGGNDEIDGETISNETTQHYFMLAYADFLNRLTSLKFIPLSSVKTIGEEYISIAKKSSIEKEKTLRSALESCHNLSSGEVERIVLDTREKDFFLKAQEELLSEHKRSKFISDNFSLVQPVEIVLNPDDVRIGHLKDCIHYVPIKESLKVLMEDKTFIEVFENSRHEKVTSTLEDLKDGAAYRNNDFFCQNPEAMTLLLYSDAVELTNPLGSGRLKHKVVQVFWSVCDIPKRHRSQIDKLQLGLVFREKLLKKYKLSQVFRQFVEDLKDLEDTGIIVNKPEEKRVKAGVIAYAADNLEAHVIGGFSGSFSSKDICRFCHCQHDDLAEHIHNYVGGLGHEPWTITEYDSIVEQDNHEDEVGSKEQSTTTEENLFDEFDDPDSEIGETFEQDSEEEEFSEETNENYGIKGMCDFNNLRSFHCVTSMPPDCLHDLLEGVLAQDLLGIIRILKAKGWFSIEDYNQALKKFPLSVNESSNKPQSVPCKTSVKKLSGKAVSIWCHARFFLSILKLNDWIQDSEDEVFKLAGLMVDITNRVTAEKFEHYEIERLEDLVIEFLDARKAVLAEYPILGSAKPKHHFITHYPDSIRNFGPPMGYWTGRYESKHRVAKSIADSSKNFKNISKTVSTRQQLRMASTYFHGMFNFEDYILPVDVKQKSELSNTGLEGNLRTFIGDKDLVSSEITWRERLYRKDMVVVIARQDLLEMKVGVIKAVVVRNDKVSLLVRRATVILTKSQVFETDVVEDTLVVINIEDLQDTYPLFRRGNDEKYFVIPHHHVSFMYD